MKKTALVSIAILVAVSNLALSQEKKYHIQGKFESPDHQSGKAFMNYTKNNVAFTDTTSFTNGVYHFSGGMSKPFGQVTLTFEFAPKDTIGNVDEFPLFVQLFIEPGTTRLFHPKSAESTPRITGSVIQAEFEGIQKSIGESGNVDEVLLTFSETHPASWLNTTTLPQLLSNPDADLPRLENIINKLSNPLQASPVIERVRKQIGGLKATAIGKPAIDFIQNDPAGNPVSLSSFRGKYVLVDFWASWCMPCRGENPNLVEAYNQYHPKGFEILGVSLDNERDKMKWLEAIKEDGLPWTNVSDLKGANNEAAALYGISAIPTSILVDPNGVIIAKNLRGKMLEEKLKEIFASTATPTP